MHTKTDIESEVANLLVDALNLEIEANEIQPQSPLYREGLGLDSIDILELALAISKKYGFQLRSDDANSMQIFSSLRALACHVEACRTK